MVTKMLGTFLKLTIGHFPHVRSYQNDYDPGFFPYKIIWKNLIFNFPAEKVKKQNPCTAAIFSVLGRPPCVL